MKITWSGAAVALALGAIAFAAPARAQFFAGWGYQRFQIEDGLSPGEIRASLADQGYRLVGPLRRNGRVVLADVTDRRGRSLRLIVDPFEGEILQRFLSAGPQRPGRVARAEPDDDTDSAPASRPVRRPPAAKPKAEPGVAARSLPERPRTVVPNRPPAAPAPSVSTPATRAQAPVVAPASPPPAAVAPPPTSAPTAVAPAPRATPGIADGVPNAPLD